MSNQSKSRLKVTQIASPIGRPNYQRQTLIGLGLNKIGRIHYLDDTCAIRGMISKVHHLIDVQKINQ